MKSRFYLYKPILILKKRNDYDWLGHGIYFWEKNPERAYDFAGEYRKRKDIFGSHHKGEGL